MQLQDRDHCQQLIKWRGGNRGSDIAKCSGKGEEQGQRSSPPPREEEWGRIISTVWCFLSISAFSQRTSSSSLLVPPSIWFTDKDYETSLAFLTVRQQGLAISWLKPRPPALRNSVTLLSGFCVHCICYILQQPLGMERDMSNDR